MKKGILIGGGVVVVVIVAAVAFLFSNLDSLVKEAVEKIGTDATQAKVTLNKVEIGIKSGSGALSGLTVANPKGFKTPSAFELGSISVKIDPSSIGSDVIVIKEIAIDGPKVTYDPKVTYELGDGGSNIDAIQKNVDAYAKQFGGGGDGGSAKEESEGPKLLIENLYIRGGEINVSAGFLAGKTLGTAMPDIHLTDIGKEDDGADPAEVVKQIIDSMTSGIGSAIGDLGLDKMMEDAGKMLEGATGAATEAVSEGAAEAGKAVEEGVEGAADAVKKLFGN